MGVVIAIVVLLLIFVLIVLAASIRILREYERGVIFRLGRLIAQKGPGLILLIPFIDRMVRVDLRTVTLTVPPQEVITKDNVTVRVNAVAYFRVIDPNRAVTEVENFLLATSQIAQTTLRSVLGKAELDALLSERERLNVELQQIIDEQTEPWGVKVTTVEVKDVELPADMQRAIARQAEAERERRAKIISADGEFQAAEKLAQAANIMSANPATLQLRYLQTLLDIGVNQNSTIIFPLPIDLVKPFLGLEGADGQPGRASRSPEGTEHLSTPEVRIDQLTGLRAILAPGRAERPDAFVPVPAATPRGRRRDLSRSARAARTARRRRSGRDRPGGGEPDSPGWTARAVPNLYPGARRRRGGRAPGDGQRATAGALETGLASSIDPLRRLDQGGRAGPVRVAARRGRPRGDRPLPRARDLARRARRGALRGGGRGLAGADARPRRGCLLRPPDRQRGPRRGRLARALPRPAVRDALRAGRGGPRARAGLGLPRADDGRAPARPTSRPRRSAAGSAWWRSTTRRCSSARGRRAPRSSCG